MNSTQIVALKQVSELAHAALNAEQQRLVAAGFKSQERYAMLKDLKSSADKAHAEYSKFVKSEIMGELKKIIAKQTPVQRAEGLRRARAII